MYARLVIGQYHPGKADEGVQMYRESLLPEARKQRGFKGALGLVDRSTGKGMSIRHALADRSRCARQWDEQPLLAGAACQSRLPLCRSTGCRNV